MTAARLPGVPAPEIARTAVSVRTVPEHGTRARYIHRSQACRCRACTEANTAYIRGYRAKIARASAWSPRSWSQLHLPGTS